MGEALKKETTRIKEREYIYITSTPGVVGGEPCIEGTRISVRDIIECRHLKMSIDEILKAYPHITRSQVHSALAYYYDHKNEIDGYISEHEEYYQRGKTEQERLSKINSNV